MIPMTFTPEEAGHLAVWGKRLPPKRPVVKRPEYVDCLLQVREAFGESGRHPLICNVISRDVVARNTVKRNLKAEIATRLTGSPTLGNYVLSGHGDACYLGLDLKGLDVDGILRALRILWIDQLIEEFGRKPL